MQEIKDIIKLLDISIKEDSENSLMSGGIIRDDYDEKVDEIGRGTSTYDGMSLAWAILKYNHDRIKAKTLFATHYHELIDDSESLSGVSNFSVSIGENNGKLIFLRKIISGGIKKSFGLEVASLAGINSEIILEAKKMLKNFRIGTG